MVGEPVGLAVDLGLSDLAMADVGMSAGLDMADVGGGRDVGGGIPKAGLTEFAFIPFTTNVVARALLTVSVPFLAFVAFLAKAGLGKTAFVRFILFPLVQGDFVTGRLGINLRMCILASAW